jgi:dCTP deaminase
MSSPKSSKDKHHSLKRRIKYTAVLSDKLIQKELDRGNIIIEPFDLDNLNNSSYDISLGSLYCRRKQRIDTVSPTKPLSISEVLHNIWDKPLEAKNEIIIYKGETILCHSIEFIGGVSDKYTHKSNPIVAQLIPKAMLTFAGIRVDSGYGNIGFFNRWMLNITNTTTYDIVLKIGGPIAQIIFCYSGENIEEYSKIGLFQGTCKIDKLISGWKFPSFSDDTSQSSKSSQQDKPNGNKTENLQTVVINNPGMKNTLATIIEEPVSNMSKLKDASLISECNKENNVIPAFQG